jgi:catalase
MPLPSDEKLIALSEEILKQFEAMFGSHPGFRPGHAKGILLRGTFTPSSAISDIEGKPLRVAATECWQRASFNDEG